MNCPTCKKEMLGLNGQPVCPSCARQRTAESGSDAPTGSRVDSRPEVPFHELPPERKVNLHDGIGCVIPSGAMIEVWKIEGEGGVRINIRRPLDDGRQSVLRFGLTREAALALHGLLDQQLYPENASVEQPGPTNHP